MLIKKNLIVKERRSLLTRRSKYPCIQCIFKSIFDQCMYNIFCRKLKYNYYISKIYYAD